MIKLLGSLITLCEGWRWSDVGGTPTRQQIKKASAWSCRAPPSRICVRYYFICIMPGFELPHGAILTPGNHFFYVVPLAHIWFYNYSLQTSQHAILNTSSSLLSIILKDGIRRCKQQKVSVWFALFWYFTFPLSVYFCKNRTVACAVERQCIRINRNLGDTVAQL